MLAQVQKLVAQGGWVSIALVFISIVLWVTVWIRARRMSRGFTGPLGAYFKRALNQAPANSGVISSYVDQALHLVHAHESTPARLDALTNRHASRLSYMQDVLRSLVVVAPLLGLLGTVGGMVEMFASLDGSATAVREATVAGGISKALITTQLGLIIGIPGLIAARLLERRALRLTRELHEARAMAHNAGAGADE